MNLKPLLKKSLREHWAIPHFNVSNLAQLHAVCEAAKELRSPVMIGTSESERKFIGLEQAVVLIHALRKGFKIPVFLNADHTHSVKAAKVAIDAGYNSIHIDLSKKSNTLNTKGTKEIVQYAKKKDKDISVEGELGYLVTDSSKIYKKKIKINPQTFTKPEQAKKFIQETGVDRFAPAIGNLHGIAANKPKIDFKLVKEIRASIPNTTSLVLHGGSGNSARDFKKLIKLGFNNIHISTELRVAYANALRKGIKSHPDEIAPYKIAKPTIEAVRKKAKYYIKLFGSNNKV